MLKLFAKWNIIMHMIAAREELHCKKLELIVQETLRAAYFS